MTPPRPLLAGLSLLTTVPASLAGGGDSWWSHDGAHACHHCRLAALSAASSRAFDEATGRDLLNYPRHRVADFLHMRLELDIADMNTPRAEATQTLTLSPTSRPLAHLSLDAPLLEVHSVAAPGRTATPEHAEDGTLGITFDPPIPVGEKTDVTVRYTINDPPEGLYWTPESSAWPGRPAQLHTQGQPESNRYWFPSHDFPNERMTTELVVHVPRGFTASSNGRLVSHTRSGGQETFHWLQGKDHVGYLVSLVVGKFEVVDVGSREAGGLPMPVYAPLGLGDHVRQTYGRTPDMVALFSRLVDEPYPWDRYAQLIVHNFIAGGMENTSATTMYDTAVLDRASLADGDLDGLISHELAHQWFGDLITCASWEHIWLNEGFATYFTSLWLEQRDGPDGYQAGVLGNFKSVIENDTAAAPEPGMVSKQYAHPWEVFRRSANPYPKGAAVLHMLRMKLGDEVFFRGLAHYVDRHKLGLAETADLRRALERVSGLSLQRFFDQWCARPGVPRLRIALSWDTATSELVATVEQTQTIDGPNPAFALDLPIWVQVTGLGGAARRDWQRFTMFTDARSATARFPLAAAPVVIAVDPEMHTLAELTVGQDEPAWLAQLSAGPTLAARARAADALRALDTISPEGISALIALARDGRAHLALRQAAVEALHPASALEPLLAEPPTDPRLLRTLVERAGVLAADAEPAQADRTRSFLVSAASDRSYGVRSAALSALVKAKHPDALTILERGAATDSQHDQIRQAAAGALAELDTPDALPIALRLTAPGLNCRTRAAAAEAVGKLAHHDPGAAVEVLTRLLADREARTARAAGEALAAVPEGRGRPALQAYAAQARSGIQKDQAAKWLATLDEKAAAPATPGQ